MRQGRLLTEDSPQEMLRQFGTSSLENVFLALCKLDQARQELPKYVGCPRKSVDSDDSCTNVLLQSVKMVADKGQNGFDVMEEDSSSTTSSLRPQRVQSDLRIISTLVKKTILRQIRVPA